MPAFHVSHIMSGTPTSSPVCHGGVLVKYFPQEDLLVLTIHCDISQHRQCMSHGLETPVLFT